MAPRCRRTSATAGRHGAAEHDEAREVAVGGELVGVAGEVEVLQSQPGQRTAGVEVVVQLGEGLDLHAPILRHRPALAHACR